MPPETKPAETKPPAAEGSLVVCLPPSGAGRSFFRQWPGEIAGARVLPLSRPGQEERFRQPAARSVPAAAADVVDRILRREPGRVVLFGHSLGAAVAFEAAILLSARDIAVALVVSARQAPHLPSATAGLATADDVTLLKTITSWGGVTLTHPDEPLAALLLPMLRADFALSAGHTWTGEPTAVPLISVAYEDDVVVAESAVRAWQSAAAGRYLHATERGDHFAARNPSPGLIEVLAQAVAWADYASPRAGAVRHGDAIAAEGVE